jgi:hypothetical protein
MAIRDAKQCLNNGRISVRGQYGPFRMSMDILVRNNVAIKREWKTYLMLSFMHIGMKSHLDVDINEGIQPEDRQAHYTDLWNYAGKVMAAPCGNTQPENDMIISYWNGLRIGLRASYMIAGLPILTETPRAVAPWAAGASLGDDEDSDDGDEESTENGKKRKKKKAISRGESTMKTSRGKKDDPSGGGGGGGNGNNSSLADEGRYGPDTVYQV